MSARQWLAAALAVLGVAAQAQEFRAINPIRSPRAQLPPGAQRVVPQRPVSRESIEAAVASITSAWNTPGLATQLARNFYDKDRLIDNISSQVPRDARLRVLGIQGIQVLDQYFVPPSATVPFRTMVSQVSVTVRTQTEFNSAAGFQRIDGTNEFIVEIPQAAVR